MPHAIITTLSYAVTVLFNALLGLIEYARYNAVGFAVIVALTTLTCVATVFGCLPSAVKRCALVILCVILLIGSFFALNHYLTPAGTRLRLIETAVRCGAVLAEGVR